MSFFNDYYQNLIQSYLHTDLVDAEAQNTFLNKIKECVEDSSITFNEKIGIINCLISGINNPLNHGETPLDLSSLVAQRYMLLLALYDEYNFESREEEEIFIKHIKIILKEGKMDFNVKTLLLLILCTHVKAGLQIA